jgi:hypothetical protein
MCKTNDNNPTRNPIRVAALSQLTAGLDYLGREGVDFNERAVQNWLGNVVFSFNIGVLTAKEGQEWINELHRCRERVNGVFPSCEPCRCEDCEAVLPLSMLRELVAPNDGGGISVCNACHAQVGDPRARDNASVEAGWDGRGDFEDTPDFQRGHPIELD